MFQITTQTATTCAVREFCYFCLILLESRVVKLELSEERKRKSMKSYEHIKNPKHWKFISQYHHGNRAVNIAPEKRVASEKLIRKNFLWKNSVKI